MNPLIPLTFNLLSISPNLDVQDGAPQIALAGTEIEMVVPTDTIKTSGGSIVVADVLAADGGSRRLLTSLSDNELPVDIMDGGPWGAEGFLDRFDFTDRRANTLSVLFTVADADPVITRAPEGGTVIEFTDRLYLTVFNHDDGESQALVVRDNQITYLMDAGGNFTLSSIRPKPNDLKDIVTLYRVYDMESDDSDSPLDAEQFGTILKFLFPLPGK